MQRPTASTGGVAALLRELDTKRDASATDEGGRGGGLALLSLLHIVAGISAILGAVFLTDAQNWTNAAFLAAGDVPARVVASGVVFALCVLVFGAFTFLDATYFLGTSIAVTGSAMGLATLSIGLGASLAVLAAVATKALVFWCLMVAFGATCITLGMQTAAIVSTLITQNAPLNSAILRAL